jgi:chromosome segregation ATPase
VWKKTIAQFLACLLFWQVSFWARPSPLSASEPEPPQTVTISQSEFSRLIEISSQLSALNERLRSELADSRRTSKSLRDTLAKSSTELDGLKAELEHLRRASTGLSRTRDNSLTDLTLLQGALTVADSSLTSLEQSFAAYRQWAEVRIASLEKSRGRWRVAGIAAIAVALAGGVTAAVVAAQ